MNVQSFETIRVSLGNLGKKCHLNVALWRITKNTIGKGVVPSPKGCEPCKNFYLKLSLLNSSHHLRSTCTNRPFSLVVYVDFILNFCL